MAHSNSIRSRKPKLSTTERGHQMDGWPLRARLCGRPEISLESNCVQTLTKSPSDETINRGPRVYTHAKRSHTHVKDPVVHVRVRRIMGPPE